MIDGTRFDDLGLSPEDRDVVDRVFGTGKAHPWSDELIDEVLELMSSVALSYLKARRDPVVLESFIPQLRTFIDKIILQRFEELRSAEQDVHANPPYHTADRWPQAEFFVARKVIGWAFRWPRED